MVSENHYISRDSVILYHTKLNTVKYKIYSGGCVSIEHYSGLMRIKHQLSINATENSKGKLTFEGGVSNPVVGDQRIPHC